MSCDEVRLELDAYALGALEPGEAARVERHLAGCTECARELDRLREVAGELALTAPLRRAPSGMRDAVLAAIHAGTPPAPPIPFPRATRPAGARAAGQRGTVARAVRLAERIGLPALAASAAVVLGVLAYRVSSLQSQVNRLKQEPAAAQGLTVPDDPAFRSALLMLSTPGTVTQKLSPLPSGPQVWGSVIWNPAQKQCVLFARQLPPPPEGYEYHIYLSENDVRWDGGPMSVNPAGFGEALVSMTHWQVGSRYEVSVALERQGTDSSSSPVLTGEVSLSTQ